MTVYIENANTGEKTTHYRPYGETINFMYLVLSISNHTKYTQDFKAAELALNHGLFVYELDGNNQVIRGLTQ